MGQRTDSMERGTIRLREARVKVIVKDYRGSNLFS